MLYLGFRVHGNIFPNTYKLPNNIITIYNGNHFTIHQHSTAQHRSAFKNSTPTPISLLCIAHPLFILSITFPPRISCILVDMKYHVFHQEENIKTKKKASPKICFQNLDEWHTTSASENIVSMCLLEETF